jgi:hemoglobin
LALADAHHARCLEDPELNHPFSHPGQHPRHVERLAAYLHSGNGDTGDLGRRFVDCFVRAAEDAELSENPAFRTALRAYMEWAVDDVLAYSPHDAVVPLGAATPHWSWDGLQARTGSISE